MATYCFKKGKKELFTGAGARGFFAAALDFPRLMNEEECIAAAQGVPDEMRPEVCCVFPDDEDAYHQLVTSAWCSFYLNAASSDYTRGIVLAKSVWKSMPKDEAIANVRKHFNTVEEAKSICEDLYAQFLVAKSNTSISE